MIIDHSHKLQTSQAATITRCKREIIIEEESANGLLDICYLRLEKRLNLVIPMENKRTKAPHACETEKGIIK